MPKFKEASHYKKLPEKKVRCMLCPHDCVIGNGEVGKCKVRMNIIGNLKSMNYGKPHTVKYELTNDLPLYHFLPNDKILAVGTAGDNLPSNLYPHEFSNKEPEEIPTLNQSPIEIINQAEKQGVNIISYSASEPTTAFEYMNDIFENSRRMKHILVTNGFIESLPAKQISKKINAALIDIKSMTESFYEYVMKGKLDPVLKTAKILHDNNVWVEIKMDLIQGVHENFYDVRKLVSWILNNLNGNTPLHFVNRLSNPEDAERARKIAMGAGMNYVYVHGINSSDSESTWCPNCKKPVVIRNNNQIKSIINNGKCGCGKEIAGVWE